MAALTVTPATLVSIQVTPPAASLAAGTTQQYAAVGTFTDSTTQDLTAAATWSSDMADVATVAASGLGTGVAPGFANITAAFGGVTSNLAALTVTPATLVSIQVTPAAASVAAGTTQQYAAIGTYTDRSTQDLTRSASWSSSDTNVVTVSPSGLATGVSAGSATIAASLGGVTSYPPVALTVTPATLVSIQVTPATASIAKGTTLQYVATGTYSDRSTQILTRLVAWGSSDTALATIGTEGLATGGSKGTASITASLAGVTSNTAVLTVTPAAMAALQITPATAQIAAGTAQQYTATGIFTDSTTQDLTATVSWNSDASDVATVTGTGQATGILPGSANITARTGGVTSNTAVLAVSATSLVSIQITPAAATIAAGTSLQYVATAAYTDGSTRVVTGSVSWVSSEPDDVTITAGGLATGVERVTVNVTASLGGVTSNTAVLAVSATSLVSIQIAPAAAAIAANTTQQYVATGTYTDNSTQDVSKSVSWSSSDTDVATISTGGLATGVDAGAVNVTASLGGVTSNTSVLTVTQATLMSIQVTPAAASVMTCARQQYAATGTFSDNSTQDLTSVASWISSMTGVATVSATGKATGVAVGTSTITATASRLTSNAAVLTVTTVPGYYKGDGKKTGLQGDGIGRDCSKMGDGEGSH
jgi:uncharacterized protein YjdB